MTILSLLQITDSAFPLGGYAFSSGLESMAKLGLIRDMAAFQAYLDNVLLQVQCAELPFVTSSWKSVSPEDQYGERVFRQCDAFLIVPSIRQASIRQGRSLLMVMRSCHPQCRFAGLQDWMSSKVIEPHFPPTFGAAARLIGLSCEDAAMGYCYMAMRDQISAAIRLGMLGPQEAQRLLARQLEEIERTLEFAVQLDCEQAFKPCLVLEIAQAHHTRLYSRLFHS